MHTCFATFFNESFFQGLLGGAFANVLAVILGIPAGFYLQHLICSHRGKHQCEQLRAALKRALEHNLGTFQTVREQLSQNMVPTFSLDLALFDATAHKKYEIMNDIPLCASIDHLRFEMAHLDRQLDALLRMELDPTAKAAGNFVEGRKTPLYDLVQPQLVKSVLERLPPLEEESKEILKKVSD